MIDPDLSRRQVLAAAVSASGGWPGAARVQWVRPIRLVVSAASPAVLPHVRSGRLRALAVSSPQRIPALPDVPTVAESGFPGFEADQWYGVVAPAGLPAALVGKLNAEINKALAHPDVMQQLALEGAEPMPGTPQAFGQLIAREIPRWALVAKAGNVKPV